MQDMRRTYYPQAGLDESEMLPDPITQFDLWFHQAVDAVPHEHVEPNAMTLATASPDGMPSARIVLLKGIHEGTLLFYTHYTSPKGQALAANPRAALVFYWPWLGRQVRIEGAVSRCSADQSQAYFHSRPHDSQLGAATSDQSQVIPCREVLEHKLAAMEREYDEKPVPMPPQWGGYALTPARFEFWQGQPGRLHDRLNYLRQPDGSWTMQRLSP